MKQLAAFLLAFFLVGCSNEQDAVNAALASGWKTARVVDSSYVITYGCAKDEIKFNVAGTNSNNIPVRAMVCCGRTLMDKGCTVRY